MRKKRTGLEIAALYSFGCRGSKTLGADPILAAFVQNDGKVKEQEVRQLLEKLKSFPAYQRIAKQKGWRDPFDAARAYWLSSRTTDLQLGAPLCHNYSVLLPWADAEITESLLAAINLCIVSWGRIKKVSNHSLLVDSFRLAAEKENRRRLAPDTKTILIEKGFLEAEVMVGDLVTSHFDIGREIISSEQADWLRMVTEKSLDIFNAKAKGE